MTEVRVPKEVIWIAAGDTSTREYRVSWEMASAALFVRNYYGEMEDRYIVSEDLEPEVFRIEVEPIVIEEVLAYLKAPGEAHMERWSEMPDLLIELAKTGNFLNIPALTEHCCRGIANLLRGRSPSQIRAIFGMPEEDHKEVEAEARRRLQWLLE